MSKSRSYRPGEQFPRMNQRQHERNTRVVQEYMKGVENGTPCPVDIRRKHDISNARLYQILKKYGVKVSYRSRWLDKK